MSWSVPCFICDCDSPSTISEAISQGINRKDCAETSEYQRQANHPDNNQQRRILEHSVFAIKTIFRVPGQLLDEKNVQILGEDESGNSIIQGIRFCESCGDSVRRAHDIHQALLDALENFRRIQSELVRKVKRGRSLPEDDGLFDDKMGELDKWRKFISNHDYDDSAEPFLPEDFKNIGERLAKSLEESKSADYVISGDDVKEEYENGDDELDHGDYYEHLNEDSKCEASSVEGSSEEEGTSKEYVKSTADDEDTMSRNGSHQEVEIDMDVTDDEIENEEDDEEWRPDEDGHHDPLKIGSDEESVSESNQEKEELTPSQPKKRKVGRPRRGNVKRRPQTEATFQCTKSGCSKSFLSKMRFQQHLRLEHKQFTCETCSELLSTFEELRHHRVQYHPESTFPCDHCPKYFTSNINLTHHLAIAHHIKDVQPAKGRVGRPRGLKYISRKRNSPTKPKKEATFHCTEKFCTKSFVSNMTFQLHLRRSHKQRTLPCEHCEELFVTAQERSDHMVQDHAEITFACDSCPKYFDNEVTLRCHRVSAHHPNHIKSGRHKCTEPSCEKVFASKRGMLLHRANFHKIKISKPDKFVCSEPNCGKVYCSKGGLIVHLSKHKGEPQYECKTCGESFYSWQIMRRHQEKAHISGVTPTGRAFVCEICGRPYTNTANLQAHKRQVHNRKSRNETSTKDISPQVCDLCGKTVKGKVNLTTHKRVVHERKYTHFCDHCGKGFFSSTHWKDHLYRKHGLGTEKDLIIHGPPKFICSVPGCRAPFMGNRAELSLKKHMVSAHGEDGKGKRFKCEFCGGEFSQGYKFREHRLLHINKETRPFKCDTCGKGFANRANLRYHELNTHKAPSKHPWKKKTKQVDNVEGGHTVQTDIAENPGN